MTPRLFSRQMRPLVSVRVHIRLPFVAEIRAVGRSAQRIDSKMGIVERSE